MPDSPDAETRGPLTEKVLAYTQTMEQLVATQADPGDWEALQQFVDVERFTRVGTFLEQQDWAGYCVMLTQWASSVERFETSVRRTAELPGRVYYEVEERHFRKQQPHVINSMTVFDFDEAGRIVHLDVYLQGRV